MRCTAMDQAIQARLHPSVRQVTCDVKFGLILVLTILFKWPDWELPDKLASGVQIVGSVSSTNLYKPLVENNTFSPHILKQGDPSLEVISNDEWNSEIVRSNKPGEFDDLLLEMTMKDIIKKRAEGFFTKAELDARFGKGNWRASNRRLIWQQAQQKWRAIDNYRTSKNNLAADMHESLITSPFDTAMKVALRFATIVDQPLDRVEQLVLGCEDMEDAYKTVPSSPQQQQFSIIAQWHPSRKCVVFTISFVLLFGQKAAVPNYNRVPSFTAAIARRLLGIPVWHYFDDYGMIDCLNFTAHGAAAQPSLQTFSAMLGFKVGVAKSKSMATTQIYLGLMNKFDAMDKGYISLAPTPEKISNTLAKLQSYLSDDFMDESDLESIVGDLVHLACSAFHKAVRGGLRLMVKSNIRPDKSLRPTMKLAIVYFQLVLRNLAPRKYCMNEVKQPVVLMYTDAFWTEPGNESLDPDTGLGAFVQIGSSIRTFFAKAPKAFMRVLKDRATQIGPLEMVAVLLTVYTVADSIANSKVLLFVDNMSVASSLVSGHSTQQDMQCMLTMFHRYAQKLGLLVWIEWVPTHANVADPISRGEKWEHLNPVPFAWPDWLTEPLTYEAALKFLRSDVE